jgi:rSAM/selenodomain-associated transferase 1
MVKRGGGWGPGHEKAILAIPHAKSTGEVGEPASNVVVTRSSGAVFLSVLRTIAPSNSEQSEFDDIRKTPLLRGRSLVTNDTLTIGIMTKYWEVGRVKTRLGDSIGMTRSAALHELFVTCLCDSLRHVQGKRTICLAPDSRVSDFVSVLASSEMDKTWDVLPQGDGTLGERMQRWFVHCLSKDSSRAILIGADCPTLSSDTVAKAEHALDSHDLVLGPAADGGYYLIGLRGSWVQRGKSFEQLFRDIPWSTDSVLSETRGRANAEGLSVAELETMEDVDTQAELDRLRLQLDADVNHGKLRSSIEAILSDPSLESTPTDPTSN